MMRLQRYLAQAGVASRRKAEELITAGSVSVNGVTVRTLGTVVDPDFDRVEYAGRVVVAPAEHAYYVLHKPLGVVTTMRDPEGRRTVADIVRSHGVGARIVPVGRLDYDTAGVLLLTDDGDLAHVLTHPRFGVQKTYRATVRGRLGPPAVAALGEGLKLDDGRAAPAILRVVAAGRERSTIDVTIHEGRNRQVRRMFEQLDHPVLDLVPGELRPAGEREVRELRAILAAAT
jgi:23S rRNA pseudouridine2605 synthase